MTNDNRELSFEELNIVAGGGIIESVLKFAREVLTNYQMSTAVEGLANLNKSPPNLMGTPR